MNQLKAGAILSYLNIIINIGVGLVYTPFMMRALGQSEYGLYALIGSVAAYLNILDMGLANTLVRYTARNRAVGSKRQEAELNGPVPGDVFGDRISGIACRRFCVLSS